MNPVRGCKVIADFSIIPMGQGETSVGRFVAVAISAINGVEGLKCEITPMGTVMEADSLEIILEAVEAAHEALFAQGVMRVVSTLRIDDRRDKPRTMKGKVDAVKRYIKQPIKKNAHMKSAAEATINLKRKS